MQKAQTVEFQFEPFFILLDFTQEYNNYKFICTPEFQSAI